MFVDSRKVPTGSTVSSDICIIGGGPAGITLAGELAPHAGVTLIESGALDYDRAIHDLYRGRVAGSMWDEVTTRDPAEYLQATRQRYFGGSSNCWAGFCRPLDESVFARRSWIPHSGWPIERSDLDPYYDRAASLCDIETQYSRTGEKNGRRFPGGTSLRPAIEYRSPPTRFGIKYREVLRRARQIRVCLNGSVTDMVCNRSRRSLDRIQVRTLAGNTFYVEAGTFILATGGIENARLLLNSNGQHENGIGNTHDVVGRFFMDHLYPGAVPGVAALTGTCWEGMREYDQFGIWMLDPEIVERNRLLNVGIEFESLHSTPDDLMRSVLFTTAAVDRYGEKEASTQTSLLTKFGLHVELSPHPDNRVTLSDERDALGMRRVKLHWNLTELDRHSINRSLHLFSAELGRSLAGRIAAGKLDLNQVYGAHHLGTTRMSDDPSHGVVDSNCRIHGMTNLYVAGSSVFPAGGFENPTFTILALALRLADHIGGASSH